MLDTYGRKYVNSLIEGGADLCTKFNIKANHVTVLAWLIGMSTFIFIYRDFQYVAVILLWLSGYLDAVDGSVARKQNDTTPWGTLLDITFDRMVEMSVVIALALKFPNSRLSLLILTICILFSMTIFLTVGALSEKKGMKSFYYQAGIAERTEGFILFTLMIILRQWLSIIAYIFAALVIITACQRLFEARKILK